MNPIKKLWEIFSIRSTILSLRDMRFTITRKDLADFGLVVIISFLIIIYKVNKA